MSESASEHLLLTLNHVADTYHLYSGESVRLTTRLEVAHPVKDLTVEVWLSAGLTPWVELCQGPPMFWPARLQAEEVKTGPAPGSYRVITWRQEEGQTVESKKSYEFGVDAVVGLPGECAGQPAISWTEVGTPDQVEWRSSIVRLEVMAKARCLTYLPAIYQGEEQELLWRYLMSFDRVWGLYDELLANQAAYFNPQLAPANLMNWMAEWVGCRRYRHLPEAMWLAFAPRLILQMVKLHRRRGTKAGLMAYLQFWLGLKDEEAAQYIRVEEVVAGNFILDDETCLGDQRILGKTDWPVGYFTVTLMKWPPDYQPLSKTFLRELIDDWKPAHTTYDIFLPE